MRRISFALSVATLLLVACQKPAAAEPPKDGAKQAEPAKAAPEKKAEPAKAAPEQKTEPAKAAQNFNIKIIPGEAKAGEAATSVVEITPALGYKINLEFPSRMKLAAAEGVTHAKDQLAKDDAEITEAALRFKVGFTAAKPGQVDLSGACDFSVCDESTCKLIRDEKVAWQVAVK